MQRFPAGTLLPALAVVLLASEYARTDGAIWYTASINGNLNGCTCIAGPRASVVKSAAFLRTARDRNRAVLVDAGDRCDGGDGRPAAELLEVYGELGYDAIDVGDQELSLGEPAALRVLLFHGPWEATERLAASTPGFDVIVVGHDGGLHEPRQIRGAMLVSPGEEGNRAGMLALTIVWPGAGRPQVERFANTFRLFSYRWDSDDPLIRQRIDAYRKALKVPTETGEDTP